MSRLLEDIPPAVVGERLRLAREAAGVEQQDAATVIGVARTTLIAIEKGQRRVRLVEIRDLARLYHTSVNALLRREAVHVDLAPRFRARVGERDVVAIAASQLMSDLAKAEVELENLLGAKRTRNYPPERPLLPGDVRAQAENDAMDLRQRLGFGIAPVRDIVTLLELEMGVRVYVRRVDSGISGLFAYDEDLGACILLNANHPRERRTQTAVHELGHMLVNRRTPDVLHAYERESSREEKYVNVFASVFLMPARAAMQKYQEVIAGSDKFTRRHAIVLAHFFGVSRESLVRRLEELGSVKTGTWQYFSDNGGITDAHERQVLGDTKPTDSDKTDADRPTTLRLNMMAYEANRQNLLSEGQLASLLHLDRVEVRTILDGVELEEDAPDGAADLPD